jgi:hypothetical protein
MIKKIKRVSENSKQEDGFNTKTILPENIDNKFAQVFETFSKKAQSISDSIPLEEEEDQDQSNETSSLDQIFKEAMDKPKLRNITRKDAIIIKEKKND